MIPQNLLFVFLALALITSGGSYYSVANDDNLSNYEKTWEIAKTTLNTPDAIDDFAAESITAYRTNVKEETGEDSFFADQAKKWILALAFLSLIGIYLMFKFLHSIVRYLLNLGKPQESEERSILISFLMTAGILGVLTKFSFIFALAGKDPYYFNSVPPNAWVGIGAVILAVILVLNHRGGSSSEARPPNRLG